MNDCGLSGDGNVGARNDQARDAWHSSGRTRKGKLPLRLICVLLLPFPLAARQGRDRVPAQVMRAIRAAVPAGITSSGFRLHVCATVYSRRPDGTPDLLAAGYSAGGTAIAMLSYREGTATVLNSILDRGPKAPLFLVGGSCNASVVNLADPFRPHSALARTIKISFGGAEWFLLWKDHRLVNITALDNHHPPSTAIFNSEVVDADHHGSLQIVSDHHDGDRWRIPGTDFKTDTYTFFRFAGTRYRAARDLVGWWSLDHQEGGSKPKILLAHISLHGLPAHSYQLTVINGTRNKSDRVSGARIILNGTEIVSRAKFTSATSSLTRKVTLGKMNAIQFTTWGAPGSVLYVMVEASKPSPMTAAVGRAVAAAFPSGFLRRESATNCGPKRPSWTVFARDAAGVPSLVAAAFHNDCGGEYAMLSYRRESGGQGKATILDAVTSYQLSLAGMGEVSLVDLADTSEPRSLLKRTIHAALLDGENYYFLWDGKHLRNITCLATAAGYQQKPHSVMYDTQTVDVDHKGAMQIVGTNHSKIPLNGGATPTNTFTLFRFDGVRYVPAQHMEFWGEFRVLWGEPHHWWRPIDLPHPAGSYRLVAVNGTRKRTSRVRGAGITLNGAGVMRPAGFNQDTGRYSHKITLKKRNRIEVTADGPLRSLIYVWIDREP